MKKRYLVTGGAGFIGRSLVTALIEKGHDVCVFDNEFRGSFDKFSQHKKQIVFLKGDMRDKDAVQKACRNIDSVVHLAYINGTEYFYTMPDVVLEVATKGMTNLIDGCIKENVEEFFLASSSEVYHDAKIIPTPEDVQLVIVDPFNPRYSYSGGKIISEMLAIHNSKHFKRTTIFRPHNVYGPAMGYEHVIPQFIDRMRKEKKEKLLKFPIQGSGRESRSFIFIDDFTTALMLLLQKAKNMEIYNIGTSKETTVREIANMIAKLYDRRIAIIPGVLTSGSPQRRCPDIKKLQKIGFSPNISLEEGLKRTIEWYESNL